MHAVMEAIETEFVADPVRWRALLVKGGAERGVCQWLQARQIRAYWARYQVDATRFPRHGRTGVIWRSVIPGYLFLPLTRELSSDYFEYAPNVFGLMRDGVGNVVEISDRDIQSIKRIEEACQASAIAAAYGIPFKVGEKVWLKHMEIEVVIKEIDSRRKILVEAPLFGSVVPMTLSVDAIESV